MPYQSLPPLSLTDAEDEQAAYLEWRALDDYITDGPCREWELHWEDSFPDERVAKNTKAATFRGEVHTIVGGRAPRHSGSTGKVWTAEGHEYFPPVFGMKWVRTSE